MANKENLIAGGHKFTKKENIKGGQRISWKKRKYCNDKCPRYFICPVMPLSSKSYEGKCALKQMPIKFQRRVTNVLEKGEQGGIEELRRMILDMSILADTADDIKTKGFYFDKVKDYMESTYGKKVKQEMISDQKIEVTWKEPLRRKHGNKDTRTKTNKNK